MMPCLSSFMCCRILSRHAAFRMQKRRASRLTFLRRQPQPRKSAAAACSLQAEIAPRFSSPRIAPPSFILSAQVRWRVSILRQFGHGTEFEPAQVPDFIALRGDPSDKLPGASGVGPTGAARLLQQYGTLEAALTAGRFPKQAEDLRIFRSIATMNQEAPLPSLRSQTPNWSKAAALARKWELNQLAGRLEEFAPT